MINLPKCSTFDRFKCDHAAMSKKLTSELRYTIKFVGPFARLSMDRRINRWLSPSLSQCISTFISLTKPKQGNKLYGPVGPKPGTSTYICSHDTWAAVAGTHAYRTADANANNLSSGRCQVEVEPLIISQIYIEREPQVHIV